MTEDEAHAKNVHHKWIMDEFHLHPRVNSQVRACHARAGNFNIKREPYKVQTGTEIFGTIEKKDF